MERSFLILSWVLVAILAVASGAANIGYGWLIADGAWRWVYAAAGGITDTIKTLLPTIIAMSVANGTLKRFSARSFLAVVFWLAAAVWSIQCALGLYAIIKAERAGGNLAQKETYTTLQSDINHIDKRISELKAELKSEAVSAQMAAHRHNRLWSRSKQCTDATARDSRSFCQSYVALSAKLAGARPAALIAADMSEARARSRDKRRQFDKVDLLTVVKDVDPATETLAHLIGADPNRLKEVQAIWIALLIEIGGGLGLFLLTGGRTPWAKADKVPAGVVAIPAPTAVEFATNDPILDFVKDWTVAYLSPRRGGFIPAKEAFAAFEQYRVANGYDPITPTMFGRKMTALGHKSGKRGGQQRYDNLSLKLSFPALIVNNSG